MYMPDLNSSKEVERKIAGTISTLSIVAVYIEMFFNNVKLASGTAFFIESIKGPILITNRHNLTGRDQNTGLPLDKKHGAVPNNVRFKLIGSNKPFWYGFDLYIDLEMNQPVWVEHSELEGKADVVGVLISELGSGIHHFAQTKKDWHTWEVGDKIHVLGYPFGIQDNFAIWATGYIASEPATNYDNLPTYLIDCRTRKGQSGSLVIARFRVGDTVSHKDNFYIAKRDMTHYLGVYSGRVNDESDLGVVWKMDVVRDILNTVENSNKVVDSKFENRKFKN